ncbi:hypothetical protein [Streptomyces sp. NPDC019890]|uniref:hypothetical protein n=1 Tax=Streptomyces sp. NPDC019890 TaxID=3365064 RepID=UPI00384ADA65
MTPDWLAALAAAGAAGLVSAATTDALQTTRDHFVRLLGRGDPDRSEAAARRLDALRQIAQTAGSDRDLSEARHAWRIRLQDLLDEHPDTAEDLQAVIAALPPPPRAAASYQQHGRAEGQGTVIMNQHGDQSVHLVRPDPHND